MLHRTGVFAATVRCSGKRAGRGRSRGDCQMGLPPARSRFRHRFPAHGSGREGVTDAKARPHPQDARRISAQDQRQRVARWLVAAHMSA